MMTSEDCDKQNIFFKYFFMSLFNAAKNYEGLCNSIREMPLHGARSLFLLKKEKWFIKEIKKAILENSSYSSFLPIYIWELLWLLLCISFNSKKIYILTLFALGYFCLTIPRGMGVHGLPLRRSW